MDYAVELFAQALIIIDDELYRPLAIKLFERYFCSKATSCYTAICLRLRFVSSLAYCWQTHHSDDSAPKKTSSAPPTKSARISFNPTTGRTAAANSPSPVQFSILPRPKRIRIRTKRRQSDARCSATSSTAAVACALFRRIATMSAVRRPSATAGSRTLQALRGSVDDSRRRRVAARRQLPTTLCARCDYCAGRRD